MSSATAVASMAPTKRASTLGNTALLVSYYVIDAGLLFATTLLLARYLGVNDFGKMQFALSFGMVLYGLSDPGISLQLTKLIAREPDPTSTILANGLGLRLGMVAAACGFALLPLPFSRYMRESAWVVLPVVFSEQVRGLTLTFCAVFRGFQRMIYEVIAVALERVLALTALWMLLAAGHGVQEAAWAYLAARGLAALAALLLLWWRFPGVRFLAEPQRMLTVLRESVPLGTVVIAERVNFWFAPLALAAISGEYAVGIFQAAMKITMFPLLLASVTGSGLLPAMSAAHEEPERVQSIYRFGIRLLWHVLLPAGAVTLLFAPQVIRVFFGAAYLPAAPLLQILTPLYVVYGISAISLFLMPAINQPGISWRMGVLSLVLNLTVGPLSMYFWGATGAAASLTAVNAVIALTYVVVARRFGYRALLWPDLRQILASLLSAVILWAISRAFAFTHWYELGMLCIIAVVIYGGSLILLRGLLAEEREWLGKLVGRLEAAPLSAVDEI